MSTPTSPQPAKRSSWLRNLSFLLGGLLVLFVAAYFVVTSSAFFKGVILPRASKSVGAQITVVKASISPFREVHLQGIKVQTTGTEPLMQAEEVRLRYSLFSIMGGTMKVDEISVVSPVILVVINADGTSNLDPLMKSEEKPEATPSTASSKTPQVDLKNFTVKNATVRYVKNLKDGGREIAELSGVDVTLDQLKNGQPGKLTFAAAFKMSRPTNDVLEAKSSGNVEFTLGNDLAPQSLKATVEEEVLRAEGSLRELAGLRATFTGDVTPTEVKDVSLRFSQAGKLLGEMKATGPLDLAKKEGQLKLEIASIDRQVLNLIGAPMGIDFGATTLNATSEIAITQGGSAIAANSRFNAVQFSLTQNGQTTPPLDLLVACNVSVNTTDKTALLQTLRLDGTQNQKPLLRGDLTQPMIIAWGNTPSAAGDSAFDLTVTEFDFADWKPMLGDVVSAGRFSAKLNMLSRQGGRQLTLGLTSQIAGLAMQLGATPLTQAAVALKLDGQVNEFQKINLSDYRLDLTRQNQPALTVAGSATYDGATFNLQTQIEVVMSRLLGSGPTTALTAGVKLGGSFTNQVLDLRQLQLAITPTKRAPKNELNATGQFDVSGPITKGRLSIASDTFDVTQLYDTFTAGKDAAPVPTTPMPPDPSPATVEPEPVILPLQFTAEANLGQFYLHEIAITNWQTTVKIDGGKITLDPCRLTLNGAPVNATMDLNLGVKGYAYALTLLMDRVPLEPIANTFAPAYRGQYQGQILASAQIKGAGITGVSLRKSLDGQASLSFTNANVQMMSEKTKSLVVPIAALLRIPEITASPINWLDTQVDLGGGNIKLNRFAAQSEVFEARTQGVIPIAEVLANSPLNLPVEFALRRSLAEKSSLLPPNTPPNAAYALLPSFVTIQGTFGVPKSELNKLALGGLMLQSGAGIAEKLGVKVDSKTSNLLQDITGLLTGQKPAGTNQTSTNQPGTNATPAPNLLDLFKRK